MTANARWSPALVAALLLVPLVVASPSWGARIILVSTDVVGEGFNDPTPVAPVLGNSATTLGGQRMAVFEAAAWRLGTMIASPVEIRVAAGWDSLECDATSGTLASAGPSFVFRDFSGAPRRSTWYAAALADSLAGEELGSAEDNEMSITFNEDVGTSNCLSRAEWDYRIGLSGGTGFNMEKILFHELGHGINFTTFVDNETGGKFQGFDDAYMVNLEDHTTGRLWGRMTDAQRKASATRPGELHWLGGNALAAAVRLRGGAAAGSGHPRMYSPDPLEGGSSVAHWDTVVSLNVDDFMEPFSTRTASDLLTNRLYQDLGWSVTRSAAGWVEDQNGNGAVEIVALVASQGPAGHEAVVIDSLTGETVRRLALPGGYSALDLAVLPHHAGPPASEIAVLLWRPAGSAVLVVQYDASTGEEVGRFSFPSGSPLRLLALSDYAGTAAPELLVLGLRSRTGARVWVKDAASGALIGRQSFSRSERPVDVAVVDSFGGSNAPEIAVLLSIPQQGRSDVQVRDARSAARLAQIELPEGRVYQFLGSLADFGGVAGVGELATASVDEDTGKPRLLVFDAMSGETLSSRAFRDPFVPVALGVLPSFGGTMADEVLLWTRRSRNLKPRGLVFDGGSLATLAAAGLSSKQVPLAVAVLPDVGRTAAADIVVITAATRDRLLRAFLIDGRGQRIRPLVLP